MDVNTARFLLSVALLGNGVSVQPPLSPGTSQTADLASHAQALGIAGEVAIGARFLGLMDLATELSPTRRVLTVRGMRHQGALLAAQRALRSRSVTSLAFKGATTAQATRKAPLIRPSRDVDILVCPSDLAAAHRALLADGARLLPRHPPPRETRLYAAFRRYAQEVTYAYLGTHIDLHWQLGFSRRLLPTAVEAIGRAEVVDVAGHGVATLGRRDALVHAVLHWRYGAFGQLKYALDISGLADRLDELTQVLPRPVASGVAMARHMVNSDEPWAPSCPPSGVSPRDWTIALGSITNPRGRSRSFQRERMKAVVVHARMTPSWQDRLEIPLRSSVGPLVRVSDLGAAWVVKHRS